MSPAIEPDRIQTRCRDDRARARASRQSNMSRLRDWSACRAILSALYDGRITLFYTVIEVSQPLLGMMLVIG